MDIFLIAELKSDPNTAVADMNEYLANGMPVNVTLEDIRQSISPDQDPKAGLMHTICLSTTPETLELAMALVNLLFEYGASWMLLNSHNKTPGCICHERGIPDLYQRFLSQGVTSEIFLRRMTEDVEIEEESQQHYEQEEGDRPESRRKRVKTDRSTDEPEANIRHYLRSNLEYTDNNLVTDQNDGVMMDWETPIMERSAQVITKPQGAVLNVGFGMGIIDTFIQKLGPAKHYIVEAHPNVLKYMRDNGWYDNPSVVILEGQWKDVLPPLLSQGITFDGIYFDTFSEHYTDMLEFFDLVCGLLDFGGTFSFFNGLGADKQICYDVYKKVVEFDVGEFGLCVEYENIPVKVPNKTWEGIKRSYFEVNEYALPKITFKMD